MQRGTTIPINTNAHYGGQDMTWTETRVSERIAQKSEIFYHFSENEISAFVPQEICAFIEKRGYGFCYEIVVPAGTVISEYTYGEEVRFELTALCQIRYLGKRVMVYHRDSQGYALRTSLRDLTIE